ncbi:MAG: LamG-like jellyroll fold domain-containing protein [Planctomycetota bacterium]
MRHYFAPFGLLVMTAAQPVGAVTVPQADLHYDFENVTNGVVPNLGSAGSSFDGALQTVRSGPGFTNAVISSDGFMSGGALQPTNLSETSTGAADEGFFGGVMAVPTFNLAPTNDVFTFSAWIKYGTNPNASASNNNSGTAGQLQGLMANDDAFPTDGLKLWLNRFPSASRQITIESGDGASPEFAVGGQSSFNIVPNDDTYRHVAIIYDAASDPTVGLTEIYIDGVLSPAAGPSNIPLRDVNDNLFNQALTFGGQANSSEPFFGFGVMDDIKVFADTALDADQIAVLAGLISPSLAGDFNDNGQVEQGDLNLVLTNWGQDASSAPPDGWNNTDGLSGVVDQEELNAVLTNWGGSTSPSLQGFAVPEPAALAAIGVLFGLNVRRRDASPFR